VPVQYRRDVHYLVLPFPRDISIRENDLWEEEEGGREEGREGVREGGREGGREEGERQMEMGGRKRGREGERGRRETEGGRDDSVHQYSMHYSHQLTV